jgi:hypothetical protein
MHTQVGLFYFYQLRKWSSVSHNLILFQLGIIFTSICTYATDSVFEMRFFSESNREGTYLYGTDCGALQLQVSPLLEFKNRFQEASINALPACEKRALNPSSSGFLNETMGLGFKVSSSKLQFRIRIDDLIPKHLFRLLYSSAGMNLVIDCRSSAGYSVGLISAPVRYYPLFPNPMCNEVESPIAGDLIRGEAHDAVFISKELYLSKTGPLEKWSLRFVDREFVDKIYFSHQDKALEFWSCQSMKRFVESQKPFLSADDRVAFDRIASVETSIGNFLLRSPRLQKFYHDMPWDEPYAALLRDMFQTREIQSLRIKYPSLPIESYFSYSPHVYKKELDLNKR